MGVVLILAPVIIAEWSTIVVAAAGAAAALGLTSAQGLKESIDEENEQLERDNDVEIELEEGQTVAKNLATEQQVTFKKAGVDIIVKRDSRGKCSVCARGKGKSKAELKQIAEDFLQKLTQCYIYDKVMREVKGKNFQIVNEEVNEDKTIRINIRRWD
jgi:ABC-type transporter MlaC component